MTARPRRKGSVGCWRAGALTGHRAAAFLGLAALIAITAACGGDSSDAPRARVESIDQVLAGVVSVTELTATSATVEVETRVPVMCSVVFGTDETYGSQSTDPDMGGAPHTDHSAPLRGLQPDTVYHYRLQGSAPDGTLYVSKDLTFRSLPAEDQASRSGRNVATAAAGARVAEVSSVYGDSDTWSGANAIDDDPRTEWSSAGEGDGASITIELAKAYNLSAVGFWTRTMGETSQVTRFQVEVEDGTVFGPFDIPDANHLYAFPIAARTQSIRFQVIASSGGNTGAVEVAAFTDEPE